MSATYGGGLTNIVNLVKGFSKVDNQNEYILFIKADKENLFDIKQSNFKNVCCPIPDDSIVKRVVWENLSLPKLIKRYNFDVILTSGIYSFLKKVCPTVFFLQVTLRYLESELYKRTFKVQAQRVLFDLSKGKVDKIMVLSNTVRKEFIEKYPSFADKVVVVPIGVNHILRATNRNVKKDIILSLSSIVPHKNFLTLIQAFDLLKKSCKIPYQLTIIGYPTDYNYYKELQKEVQKRKLAKEVKFTGRVPFEDLTSYFQRAILYVFPSFLEADGATPLEAMASGVPVIASSIPSVKDSCGDAATYFEPFNVEELAAAMSQIIQNPNLRQEMIQKGLERAESFTWEKAARQTIAIFEEVCNQT